MVCSWNKNKNILPLNDNILIMVGTQLGWQCLLEPLSLQKCANSAFQVFLSGGCYVVDGILSAYNSTVLCNNFSLILIEAKTFHFKQFWQLFIKVLCT